jgi:hypothetical protein
METALRCEPGTGDLAGRDDAVLSKHCVVAHQRWRAPGQVCCPQDSTGRRQSSPVDHTAMEWVTVGVNQPGQKPKRTQDHTTRRPVQHTLVEQNVSTHW